jgi:diguanylate cyclase (GGDEF)-like protein
MVSRFGGDEFLVVLHNTEESALSNQREWIYEQLRTSPNEYIRQARFSVGLARCDATSDCTIEELMIAADDRMYLDKAANKNFKRRKDDK